MSAATPVIHPKWDQPPEGMTDGFSIEMTARDIASLEAAAPLLAPDTPVAVTFLPGETLAMRIAAAKAVRRLGFEPMPHFSARRFHSRAEFEEMARAVTEEAGVWRAFVIAGDTPTPEGPFADSSAILATGVLERAGIRAIGIAGHPTGHPVMIEAERWAALASKCAAIEARGMAPLIVTQFGFEAAPILAWLAALRARGIDAPARIGVPGPASAATLLRFAARCGVSASASAISRYGLSLGKLIGAAGPDLLVDALGQRLGPQHGRVRLHFYPFGGLRATAEWIAGYARRDRASASA